MSRFFRFAFKSVATLFAILTLLVMIAAWGVAFAPISSTQMTPYVESLFSLMIHDSKAEIGQSAIGWDNKKQNITLACQDVIYKDESGNKLASLKAVSFKIHVWNLLRGRILPEELVSDGSEFWLVRDSSGLVSLGKPKPKTKKLISDETLDFAFLQYLSDEIANPNLRQKILLNNIVFNVHDEDLGEDWALNVPEIMLNHDKKTAKGGAKVEAREKDGTAYLQVAYDFDFAGKLHNVALTFKDIKPAIFATQHLSLAKLKIAEFPVSGEVSFSTDRDLNVAKASLKIDGGRGVLNEPSFWDKPRALERLSILADYDKLKDSLQVSKAEIDFGGPRLNLTLDAKIPAPKDILWLSNKQNNNAFTMTITLDNLPMDQFGDVWPKTIIPDARGWMVTSMHKGLFTHGEVTLQGKARLDDLENLTLTSGGGKISAKDGVIDYLDGMPAVEGANAEATFDLKHMDIRILTGHTGEIKIQPFTLVIDRFQEDVQHITIPIRLNGPVRDVLRVLDAPPLGYAKAMGLTSEDSSGQVEGVLTLTMPLLDALLFKDVGVKAEAKITDFGAKKLVPGIEITQGNLALDLNKDGFDLKGAVGLNKVPSQLVWHSNFGSGRVNAPLHDGTITANLKGDQWGLFYGLDTLAHVVGETPVSIRYTNVKKGVSKVIGQVGLKQAAVQLKDVGWDKPQGTPAQLGFTLDLNAGKNPKFSSIDLQGQGVRVKGTAELDNATGKLIAMNFNPFVLGRSNATVNYIRPVDPELPLLITLEGESFDVNGIDDAKSTEATEASAKKPPESAEVTRPKEYTIKLVKFYTSDDGFMASMKAHALRDKLGWKQLDIWGVAQGGTPVAIKLLPEGDHMVFSLNADNLGNALHGLGLSKGVKSGRIEITGASTAADLRTINGKIKIDSFVVTDLPILARLMSAVSPFGYVDFITGEASFNHLLADYKWHGDDAELIDLRAAGSVVGIALSGHINLASGTAHLGGTVVPFSFMNSIIGAIPLLGDVITGGSGGGIIAAAFTMRGPLSDPNISVNPISLLAPGILRSLLFSGGNDEEPTANAVSPVALPSPQKEPRVSQHPLKMPSSNNLTKKK